ncbi:hypothetical protein KSD_16860 [Ktedonobacter sp. SOSP1-85]|nr:hypothetical protein KSD_16860 [Ktedonobacter sp. SOSP1-85]
MLHLLSKRAAQNFSREALEVLKRHLDSYFISYCGKTVIYQKEMASDVYNHHDVYTSASHNCWFLAQAKE